MNRFQVESDKKKIYKENIRCKKTNCVHASYYAIISLMAHYEKIKEYSTFTFLGHAWNISRSHQNFSKINLPKPCWISCQFFVFFDMQFFRKCNIFLFWSRAKSSIDRIISLFHVILQITDANLNGDSNQIWFSIFMSVSYKFISVKYIQIFNTNFM